MAERLCDYGASAVKYGGVLESLALMSFGNQVGARVELAL